MTLMQSLTGILVLIVGLSLIRYKTGRWENPPSPRCLFTVMSITIAILVASGGLVIWLTNLRLISPEGTFVMSGGIVSIYGAVLTFLGDSSEFERRRKNTPSRNSPNQKKMRLVTRRANFSFLRTTGLAALIAGVQLQLGAAWLV